MSAETVEVPFHEMDDGRWFFADIDMVGNPEAYAFVQRMADYWTRDDNRQGYISPPFRELPETGK